CLNMTTIEADACPVRMSHLGRRGTGHSGDAPYTDGKIQWSGFPGAIHGNLVPDLIFDLRQCTETVSEVRGGPQARQVAISVSVAKPAPHLQQGVVLSGGAKEERNREPLEGEPTRQDRAANDNVGRGRARI